MSNIKFTMKDLDGTVMPYTSFVISTSTSANAASFTTNVNGEATVSLTAVSTPYYISKQDGTTESVIAYKFFVPDTAYTLDAELLFVDMGKISKDKNDKSIAALIEAKVVAVNAANRALQVVSLLGDVSTIRNNLPNLVQVASNLTNISAVNANATNINTVAGNNTNINKVATIDTNVTTVANSQTNVNTVATNIANVNTVAPHTASIATVATNVESINTVSGSIASVNTTASNIANVNTVASNTSNISSVAGIGTAVSTVANNIADIQTTADGIAGIPVVMPYVSNIATVAANISPLVAVGNNINNVNDVRLMEPEINILVNNIGDLAGAAAAVSQAVDAQKDIFVAGTDYTKDLSTALTITYLPSKTNAVKVFFNGIYQNKDTFSRVGKNITFDEAISADKVEIHYEVPSQFVGLDGDDNAVLVAAQNAAQASANAAAASFDSFDDRYLGAKSVAPTVDNDGNALLVGAKYFNSTENKMYVRNSSNVWQLDTAESSAVNYLPAGTGTVATDVQSKLRELVSVGDYGDTDGIGTITINVPSQFATIQAAFNWLRSKTIAAGTTVVIQVADGTHDYTGTAVSLNHPQGSQIRLVGNETTPTNCVLTWTNTSSGIDCLLVSNGNTLGYINGLHITRTAHAGTANTSGLLADSGATMICGPNMRVSNHYYGIAARYGSYIRADGAVVSGAGDVGIWAFVGSTIDCSSAVVTSTADPLQPLGFGIQAEYGSVVNCVSASTSGNKVAGIAALSGSSVRCHGATSNSNTGSGLLARDGATIEAHGATTNVNSRYGIEEIANGTVYYADITQSGNTLGNRAPVAALNAVAGLGARVSSSAGALRVDTSGADPVYFHTAGGLQFAIAHVADAVNHARVRGSTSGGAVVFDAEGSNTNIDVSVLGKGTGSVFLGAQQSNFARVSGAGSGGIPSIRAEGVDTDIDLLLDGKGTGGVRWGKHFAGSVTTNGYVEWKLADGATVRVAAQRL